MSQEECRSICRPSCPPSLPHQHLILPTIYVIQAASPSWFRNKGVCSGCGALLQRSCYASARNKKKGKQSFGVLRANALQECLWFSSEPAEQPLCATWQAAASSLSTHTEKRCKNSTHAPQGLGLSCLCIHKHIPSSCWTRNRGTGI